MGIGRKKGITIVMLVVTVILLIILTVAVISSLDQNDMFGETHTTIGNYNKQAMIEEIKIELQKGRLEKLSEGDYNFDLKEDVIPIIETFGTYEEHKLKLTTTETKIPIYLYEVVDVYLGELVKVEFINNELTITEEELKLTENGYKYEYSEDNGVTWKEYTGQTIVSQPEEVKLRLVNTEEEEIAKEESFNSQEVCYVTKIEIMTEPTKKTYIAGEKFNNAGMVIIATYEDNTTKIIRNYQYSPVQELTTSDKNAVISYTEHGKTVTVLQPITVTNFVERITIATAPRHVTYRQGQVFDKTGMVVKAIYQDGSERQVTNYTVTPNGALTVSDTSVTITYEEEGKTRTAIQNIKVAALDSIAVEITPTTTDYKHGDVFNESGMTITAIYKYPDNTTFGLPVTGWSVANPILSYGQESVAITYTEGGITKTTTQNIRVATLDSIAVETAPTKTGYKHGDTFDQTGMTIRATYKYPDNTTFSSIVTGWNVTNPSITYAEPSVTISYTECGVTKTTTTSITVNRILASIAVTTAPTKTVYKYGETFDKAGMVVQATYTDSATPVAVTGYTVTNGSNLPLTQTSVTISYTENGVTKTTTTPITVKNTIWAGEFDIGWYVKNPSATSYNIYSPAELAGLALLTANIDATVYYDANYYANTTSGAYSTKGLNFTGKTINIQSDLNLNNKTWTMGGTFAGTLNGNGHTVKGLYLSTSGAASLIQTNTGTIKKLIISDSTLTSTGGNAAGLVVSNSGTVDSCAVLNSNITGYGTSHTGAGGIVCSNGGLIVNSYNTAKVELSEKCTNYFCGQSWVGGIAGSNGLIVNCYNAGQVVGGCRAGGFTGTQGWESATPRILNCYNMGSITGTSSGVGFGLGWLQGGNIQYCYGLSSYKTNAVGGTEPTAAYVNNNNTTFSGSGTTWTLAGSISPNGTATTNLLTALNDWVTANGGAYNGVALCTWKVDSSKNGGKPILSWQ